MPGSLGEGQEADTQQTPDARRAEEYLMLPSLEDVLAPASAELTPRWLALGDEVASVVPIVGYPRYVYPGWFGQLVDLDLPYLEASWHLAPRESVAMIRTLRRRLTEFDASRRLDARQGRMHDPERELAYQDVAQMIERLQRGEERIFDAALYLLVRAQHHDAQLLAQRVRQVESALNTLFLEGRSATFEQDIAFRSCLPLARDELRRTRQLDAATIATAFPFSSMSLSMPEGILYGVVPQNNSLIVLDPFSTQLENANMVVFAKSGAGKSFFCKLLALRSRIMGTSVCIIDPEPLEEYQPLCDAVHGTYIRLAPGAGQRINPFDLAFSDQAGGHDRSDLLLRSSPVVYRMAGQAAGHTSMMTMMITKAVRRVHRFLPDSGGRRRTLLPRRYRVCWPSWRCFWPSRRLQTWRGSPTGRKVSWTRPSG